MAMPAEDFTKKVDEAKKKEEDAETKREKEIYKLTGKSMTPADEIRAAEDLVKDYIKEAESAMRDLNNIKYLTTDGVQKSTIDREYRKIEYKVKEQKKEIGQA